MLVSPGGSAPVLAHVPSFGRNPRGSPDFLAYPVPKACMHVLGTRVPRCLGNARSASSPKAAQALGCSLTPGLRISFGRVTCMARAAPVPGLWALGSYCCAAFVFGSGWRLGVGFVNPASPGWGLGWVCLGTVCGVVPLVSAVCGVRGWASVSACFWDVCGFVGAPLAPRRFRLRRAVWACVLGPGLGCAQPFLGGCWGVFFAFFFSRAFWSLSLHPLSFRLGWWLSLFFFRCPFSPWAAVTGLVLPVLGGWSPCASVGVLSSVPPGGGFGRLWWCWRAVWRLWAIFVPFPPPPSFFFSGGGGLSVPPSAFPGLAHALACIQCCLQGCCFQLRSVWPRSGPMGGVGYVHGGLGAPSCRVRSWLCRLGGCARRLLVVLG